MEGLEKRKGEVAKVKGESEGARKFFGGLVRESEEGRHIVEGVDLEGPGPGATLGGVGS